MNGLVHGDRQAHVAKHVPLKRLYHGKSESVFKIPDFPQRILSTLQAYRDAAVLNTAIELELFTRIAHGADTAHRIASELEVPERGIRLLCDSLGRRGTDV